MIITREEFKDLINRYFTSLKLEDQLADLLKIDMFDCPISENAGWFFDRLMDTIVKKEYSDTLSAYMYPEDDIDLNGWDRPEHPLQLFSADGETIDNSIATLDDLYNYIYSHDGFRTDYRTSD